MVDSVMPMRLQGRSWQQPLASLSHDAVSDPAPRATAAEKIFRHLRKYAHDTASAPPPMKPPLFPLDFFLTDAIFCIFRNFCMGFWTQQRLADPTVSK
jgi:hypothetical protein